jgi:hypothetical protein
MKYLSILFCYCFFTIATKAQINQPFYIINVAAVKTEKEAKIKSNELIKLGYNSSYLWIPDYPSLSGANFYSVFIGPYSTQYDCEFATEEYRKKHPEAYGLLVSSESKRVQINGIGKVVVTNKATKKEKKYKRIKGKYTEYFIGDVSHWIFKGLDGTEYNFMVNKDQSYDLTIGDDINPKFKNRLFDVYYNSKIVDYGTPGPGKQKVDVIEKLVLLK